MGCVNVHTHTLYEITYTHTNTHTLKNIHTEQHIQLSLKSTLPQREQQSMRRDKGLQRRGEKRDSLMIQK